MEKFKQAVNPFAAVPFAEKGKILTKAAGPEDVGTCVLLDGTGYVCDVNFIPGVNIAMLDWWFVWRGLKRENYTNLDPKENLGAQSMQVGKSLDEDLDIHERLWDTTQEIVKLGEMGPVTTYQNFKCPTDIGFDTSALKDGEELICYRTFDQGEPPMAGPDGFVAHILREKDGGVEVTTYQWIGWTMMYGLPRKALPDGFFMPPVLPVGYIVKNTMEFVKLGQVLPKLYEENGGKLQ
ncbi:MAG: hypothetical protein K6B15_05725 [Parasporobacterium sp.]|nr:hypothetical protein [Parasporobacterium sp.]